MIDSGVPQSRSQRFNLSPKQNGNIALVQALGLIAASVLAGPLIESQGTKAGLLSGLGLAAAALLLLPRSKGYGSVAVCLLLLGLGGGIVNGAFVLAGSMPGNAARIFNLVTLFFGLRGMATPFIAANLFKKDSVKLCWFAGLVTVVTFALHAATAMPPAKVGFQLARAGQVIESWAFRLLAAMLFLYTSVECGVWNWMARHLITEGISESSPGERLCLACGRRAKAPLPLVSNTSPIYLG